MMTLTHGVSPLRKSNFSLWTDFCHAVLKCHFLEISPLVSQLLCIAPETTQRNEDNLPPDGAEDEDVPNAHKKNCDMFFNSTDKINLNVFIFLDRRDKRFNGEKGWEPLT